ncbi:hypothetical protein EDC01DRAFT_778765 [Geopyxis carbonaria]|nr:hypothetical protein EDC01DRAFT_778765 [Geopyxis carbonaria]
MFSFDLPPVQPNECKWRCGKTYEARSNWLLYHEQLRCPLRPRKRPRTDDPEEARLGRPFPPDEHPGPQPESSCSESDPDEPQDDNATLDGDHVEGIFDDVPVDAIYDDQPEDIPMSSLSNRRFDNAAEAGIPIRLQIPDPWFTLREKPFDPFSGEHDYKLARWFVKSKTPKGQIDDFFNDGLHGPASRDGPMSFRSGHTLWKQLEKMDGQLPSYKIGAVTVDGRTIPFLTRNIIDAAKYLIGQPCYKDYLQYAPYTQVNSDGERQFNEMNTGDWWHDTQKKRPRQATLVPLIFSSDETHLTNFSGGKKAWPVYMTIGNLDATVRSRWYWRAQVLVALLPIKPKKSGIRGDGDNEMSQQAKQALYTVLRGLLEPFNRFANPEHEGRPVEMLCADGSVRSCWPVLAAWIADHPEHANLQGTKGNVCPTCTVHRTNLGELGPEAPLRDSEMHKHMLDQHRLAESDNKARASAQAETWYYEHAYEGRPRDVTSRLPVTAKLASAKWFMAASTRTDENVFWGVPFVTPSLLPRPDVLHVMLLGIFKTAMNWVEDFLKKHDRADKFDDLWAKTPAYADDRFKPPTKRYREVVQWQGKEMRNLARIILIHFSAALANPSPAQKSDFQEAIRCVRALVQFHLMTEYESHTEATIGYLEHYLAEFHRHKEVFRWCRADARLNTRIADLRTDYKGRIAEAQRGMNNTMQNKIKRDMLAEMETEIKGLVTELAHFNFPKIHLMRHFGSSVKLFGNLKQYSTETSESAHKYIVKDAYNRSNKQVDIADQLMAANERMNAFHIRELNLKRFAADGHYDYNDKMIRLLGLHSSDQRRHVNRNMKLHGEDRTLDLTATHDPEFRLRDDVPRRVLSNFDDAEYAVYAEIPQIAPWTILGLLEPFYRRVYGIDMAKLDHAELRRYVFRLATELRVPFPLHQDSNHGLGYVMHTLSCTGRSNYRKGPPRNDNCWISVKDGDPFWRGKHVGNLVLCRLVAMVKVWRKGEDDNKVHAIVRDYTLQRDYPGVNAHGLSRWLYNERTAPWVTALHVIKGGAHCMSDGSRDPNMYYANTHIDVTTWNLLQEDI